MASRVELGEVCGPYVRERDHAPLILLTSPKRYALAIRPDGAIEVASLMGVCGGSNFRHLQKMTKEQLSVLKALRNALDTAIRIVEAEE